MTLKEKLADFVVGTLFMITLFGVGWFCMVVF